MRTGRPPMLISDAVLDEARSLRRDNHGAEYSVPQTNRVGRYGARNSDRRAPGRGSIRHGCEDKEKRTWRRNYRLRLIE